MNIYLDLHSGISGDMFCGTLLNLGVPFEYLCAELQKLNLDGYKTEYSIKLVNGISCGDFDVILDKTDHIHHHHNSLSHILHLIENSQIDEKAKEIAKKVFMTLAESEAKVHNTTMESLHFHEVGAVDSIVDIVGASICLSYLKIDKIYFGDLPSFKGEIKCAHGIIPLPGPAVAELTLGMKWNDLCEEGELITPTGAAFLKALGCQKNVGNCTFIKVGYGCGKRETVRGNYMRGFLFEEEKPQEEIIDIEFNVDDMSPEMQEPLMTALSKAGAKDVMIISGMMKKQRLGFLVKVLCKIEDFDSIVNGIFENSSTIGIRYTKKERICLEREKIVKNTDFGEIEYKNTYFKGKLINSKPEYESLKEKSCEYNIPIKEIINKIDKN